MGLQYMDRTNPMDKHMEVMINRYGVAAAPAAPQMFGNAGREHMEKYGKISVKSSVCNMRDLDRSRQLLRLLQ